MADHRVYLHIGTPKTGTTHVQEMLWHNRERAATQGLLYPGYVHSAQFHAAVDLQRDTYADWVEPIADGAWARLVEHIAQWPGDALISSELLATANHEQVRRALASLAFAEVHVVATARDLARQIPSVWQENIRNRHTETFADFLAAIRDPRPNRIGDQFWSYQDLPRVLSAWGADLPAEHVHVVTVPSTGENSLWQRFTGLLRVDPSGFTRPTEHDNTGLGSPQTEVLRRLNLAMDAEVGWQRYNSVVKEYLAAKILPAHGDPARIVLPLPELSWVRRRAEQMVELLDKAGYDVVGDLAELLPATAARPPAQPTEAELLDTAVTALADLVGRLPANPDRDSTAERVKHALRDFSESHPPVMALRQLYWKGKAQLSWARRLNRHQ